MSCCGGSCGCGKNKVAPKNKDARLESREVGKLCPVCDAEYLASGPFFKKNSVGLDTTYCVDCGMQEVWAYLAKCWCGAVIRPRDRHCYKEGHGICCPGTLCSPYCCGHWHDFSERFVKE